MGTPGTCARSVSVCELTTALFSACGVEGKYPVLQKESPSVQTVTCLDCDTSCFMCSGPGSNECTECNLDGSLPFLRHHTCVASCGDGYYLVDDYYCDGRLYSARMPYKLWKLLRGSLQPMHLL